MKKIIFSLIIAAALVVSATYTASANTTAHTFNGEPNFKGSDNFAKSFPEAMVKSYETKDGKTKVEFTWNGDALEAYYDLNGNLLATSHFLNINNLPMSVKMQVNENYKDYTILQAVEFYHADNGLSYFVMLKKETKGVILQVNPDGGISVAKRLKN